MDTVTDEARRASGAIFGNASFAVVVRCIHELAGSEGELVTTRQVAASTGIGDSQVRPVLLRLVQAGMLSAVPKLGGARGTQWFSRTASSLWSGVEEASGAILARGARS